MMEKQTIVVKVGTSSLTLSDGTMDAEKIRNITTQLAALQTAGHHVILVSSGAIAAGFSRLGFKKRPTKIADKQAAAAVGQGLLMEEYTKNLMAYQIPCAQILLNRSDFEDRRRYKNIFGSLSVLLGRGAIPIINENDTIAIEELKVGDNDTLSAQVAAMLHASLLILLTDIDGLYTANPKSDPNARHIDVVNEITPELTAAAGGSGSGNGRHDNEALRRFACHKSRCAGSDLLLGGGKQHCACGERNRKRNVLYRQRPQHENASAVDGILCAECGQPLRR